MREIVAGVAYLKEFGGLHVSRGYRVACLNGSNGSRV